MIYLTTLFGKNVRKECTGKLYCFVDRLTQHLYDGNFFKKMLRFI